MVAWGDAGGGGDCSKVQAQLVDVQSIYSTDEAFAALKGDGSVVAWGNPTTGGRLCKVTENESWEEEEGYLSRVVYKDNEEFVYEDESKIQAQLATGVQSIYSTQFHLYLGSTCANAFAALKADGSVVVWGNSHSFAEAEALAQTMTALERK